jgi:hypothetical protein
MSKYHRLMVSLIGGYMVLMEAAITMILPLAMDGVSSSRMACIKTESYPFMDVGLEFFAVDDGNNATTMQ